MDVKKIFLATLFIPNLVKRFIIVSVDWMVSIINDNPVSVKFFS